MKKIIIVLLLTTCTPQRTMQATISAQEAQVEIALSEFDLIAQDIDENTQAERPFLTSSPLTNFFCNLGITILLKYYTFKEAFTKYIS